MRAPPLYVEDTETGCWVWQGKLDREGYGRRSGRLAHRVYYERDRGPIPDGLGIDHLCRNRACVNPDHLEPVTQRVNNRRGGRTKLSETDVAEIRELIAQGWTQPSIGVAYGVAATTVASIATGQTWADSSDGRVPANSVFERSGLRNSTSAFRGVSWDGRSNRWRAQAQFRGVKRDLGFYESETEAAQVVEAFWSRAREESGDRG